MTVDYKVELTPLVRLNEYGDTIDISNRANLGEVSPLKQEIDQGNYEIGVFNYGSVNITLNNFDGKFNERSMDARSIFPWYRDRAKVDIYFIDSESSETISFRGLIADKATRQNLNNQTVTFTLLSLDSIFQQVDIIPGTIVNGTTFSEAFGILLNIPFITTILNYSSSNINPTLDLTIDDGSYFDRSILKPTLNDLLLAANSVLYIDDDKNIIVDSRDENSNTPHEFFHNDQFKRDNIDSINLFNNGLHRMFNSVVINDVEAKNNESINEFAVRQKTSSLSFITSETKSEQIAQSLLSKFGLPQTEFELTTSTEIAKDIVMLDRVVVDYRPIIKQFGSEYVALYETDEYEKVHYPYELGDITLNPNVLYKTIGIFKDVSKFRTTIKLRDTGKML
jgi:hypothetical protein